MVFIRAACVLFCFGSNVDLRLLLSLSLSLSEIYFKKLWLKLLFPPIQIYHCIESSEPLKRCFKIGPSVIKVSRLLAWFTRRRSCTRTVLNPPQSNGKRARVNSVLLRRTVPCRCEPLIVPVIALEPPCHQPRLPLRSCLALTGELPTAGACVANGFLSAPRVYRHHRDMATTEVFTYSFWRYIAHDNILHVPISW